MPTIQSQYDNHTRYVEDLKTKALKGDGPSSMALAGIYNGGQWVKTDYFEACKWFKLAQLQGVSDAGAGLTNCVVPFLSPEQIDAAEAEARQLQNGRQ